MIPLSPDVICQSFTGVVPRPLQHGPQDNAMLGSPLGDHGPVVGGPCEERFVENAILREKGAHVPILRIINPMPMQPIVEPLPSCFVRTIGLITGLKHGAVEPVPRLLDCQ